MKPARHFSRRAGRIFLAAGTALALTGLPGLQAQQKQGVFESTDTEPKTPDTSEAAKAPEWTDADTRLANQYLQLLETKPEYGKVLDLLWEHYMSHRATPLLLEHFRKTVDGGDAAVSVRLIDAHLLRKNGDLEEARRRYEALADAPEAHPHATLGLADLAIQGLPDPEAAESHLEKLAGDEGIDPGILRDSLRSLATLYLEKGDGDAALRTWNRLREMFPGDLPLLEEIAAGMIGAGYLDEATGLYESLRDHADPEVRVAVLDELARLYELANDVDGALGVLEAGRSTTHFKHHTHLRFLSALVRLHEREGTLAKVEKKFLREAERTPPTEQALFTLVRFYDLTAEPEKQEAALLKLVAAAPGRPEYRQELVEVLLSNDHYAEAEGVLDELIAAGVEESLELRLLRVRVALHLSGREAGSALLADFIESRRLDERERGDVLSFAEGNYLDEIAEKLLMEQAGGDGDDAVFALANLHSSRGRLADSRAVLDRYVEAATDPGERAERLSKAAAVYQNMRLTMEARAALEEAIGLEPGNREYLLRFAELEADAGKLEDAIKHFERAWALSENEDDRADVDQRLHSLLQLSDLEAGIAVKRGGTWSGSGPQPVPVPPGVSILGAATGAPAEEAVGRLEKFYQDLRDRALEERGEVQLRAAWWAHRLGDYPSAYRFLYEYRKEHPNNLRAERLLLDVALSSNNHLQALRQLELLATLDGERKMEYRLQRAQVRIQNQVDKSPDAALADLDAIAGDEKTDPSVLEMLSRLYEQQGRTDKALSLLNRAFEESSLPEKRRLIDVLNRMQVKAGDIDGALDAMTELIRDEHDLLQRRKELVSQVRLAIQNQRLTKLEEDYEALRRRHPLEPFYAEALALVYENTGKTDDAFAAIKKAYYTARTRDGYLLERMRQLAAETEDVSSAIYYQRQLVAAPDNNAEAGEWQKLIRMLELDFQVREADRIRLRLESKFAQDPEVLEELTAYYLRTRQPEAARRVLGRMVRLRPWDVESRLRLGLLERSAGNDLDAAEHFFAVLRHTTETVGKLSPLPSLKAGKLAFADLERFPLRGFSRQGRPELGNSTRELQVLVDALDDVRLVDNRLRVQVAQFLESGREEFLAVPGKDDARRLRAIEELGEMLLTPGADHRLRKRWERFFEKTPPASVDESFWVAWCGGDWDEAWSVLDEHLGRSEVATDELAFTLFALRMNRIPQLVEWVRDPSAANGASRRRLTWVITALHRDIMDPETGLPETQAIAILESDLLRTPHLYTMLNLLNKEGRVREALRFGELAREHAGIAEPLFDYSLASLAYGAGQSDRRRHYLEQAREHLDPRTVQFQEAVISLHSLQESDDRRRELLEWALGRLDSTPRNPRTEFGRARFLTLAGDETGAARAINRLVSQHLDQGMLVQNSFADDFVNESSQWISLFDYANGARRFGLKTVGLEPFSSALTRSDLIVPRTDESDTRFREFQHYFFQQLLWEFQNRSFAERRAILRRFTSFFRNPSDWESLARTLGGENFHRDTIPIYRSLLDAEPLNHDYSRSFFGACENAQAYEPALEYLDQLLRGDLPKPEGVSGEYIQRKYALFLWMERNVERLAVFARTQLDLGEKLAPELRHYHQHLASLFMEEERFEEALEVYGRIDDGHHKSPLLLRRHATALEKVGRPREAVRLLERIEFTRQASASEKPFLQALAPLHAQTGELAKLRLVAMRSLEHDDDALTNEIAEVLASADLAEAGESLRLLAMRRTATDAARMRLGLAAFESALASGEFARARPFLEILFACDASNSRDEQRRLIELIREAGDADPAFAKALREFVAEREGVTWNAGFVAASRLELELGDGRLEAAREAGDALRRPTSDPEEIALGIESCLAHDAPELASELFSELTRRQSRVLDHAAIGARVHAAAGNEAAGAALFQELLRHRFRGYIAPELQMAIPQAYRDAGNDLRADRLYTHFRDQILSTGREHRDALAAQARFLMDRGEFFRAEDIVRQLFRKNLSADPELIVDLYAGRGRLESLPGELRKFDLSSGLSRRVQFLAAKRMREESLSEEAEKD